MAGPVWPGWRGDGSGVSDEIQAPMQWDQEHGITWKTRIAGEGNSSPIVWHDKVFLTASTQNGQTRLIICVSAETGNILWQTPVVGEQTRTYPKSGRASPTPVTDGRRVYALFDAPGLVALDMDGQVLWTKTLGPFENVYNMASSPIVVGDLVIVNCDHSGPRFIVAFDKVTGDERWRTPRKGGLHYSTPIVVPRDGVNQVVVNAHTIVAYAAATGEPIWWFEGMKHATTPTALFHNGLVYATSGRNGPSVAIDPGGSGDVSATHVRMHVSSGGPYVVSPLIVAGQLVLPGDNGRMLVVDDQGRVVLRYRVRTTVRKFTASPILAGGHIYWPDESGRTHVLRPVAFDLGEPRIEQVVSNPLDENCVASPALAAGRLYMRTAKHLYCIVGGDARIAPPPTVELPDEFEELSKLYGELPKGEFDDTNLRIAIVVKAAAFDTHGAIDLLAQAALRDGHWDVCEEAIRALGDFDERAVPALLKMFKEHRPFLKTVAAEHLTRIKSAAATDTLIQAAKVDGRHVRIGAIAALGHIAATHEDVAPRIAAALVGLAGDTDGLVRRAAVNALARCQEQVGDQRGNVIAALRGRLDDSNVLVVESARRALVQMRAKKSNGS